MRIYITVALLLITASFSLADVKLHRHYAAGEIKYYQSSIAIYSVDSKGKASTEPFVSALALTRTEVLKLVDDGTVKLKISMPSLRINGQSCAASLLKSASLVMKLDKYGNVIAVEIPGSESNTPRVIDLKPYLGDRSTTSWLPAGPLVAGTHWQMRKTDPNLPSSYLALDRSLVSVNEQKENIACCRIDLDSTGYANLAEAAALLANKTPAQLPQATLNQAQDLCSNLSGKTTCKGFGSCWLSLEDGSLVAVKANVRASINLSNSAMVATPFSSRTETQVTLRQLSAAEAQALVFAPAPEFCYATWDDWRLQQCAFDPGQLIQGLSQLYSYTTQQFSLSVFGLLGVVGDALPLDFGFKMIIRRSRMDGSTQSLGKFNVVFGPSIGLISLIDLFGGIGFCLSGFPQDVEPGHLSTGFSLGGLFVQSNLSLSSQEVGLSTSLLKATFAVSSTAPGLGG